MTDSAEMYRLLHERFGYQHFRDGQQETIESLLAGHDTLAVLPTGAGKSLLYQLPAYLRPGGVVIVDHPFPLRSGGCGIPPAAARP